MSRSRFAGSSGFRFLSLWVLGCGAEEVWAELVDFHSWRQWWRGLIEVAEIAGGGPDGVGQRARCRWRGPVPYTLGFEVEVTAREPHRRLAGSISGDLTGSGEWRLSPDSGATLVEFRWAVELQRAWMRLAAPLARPVFVHGHDRVMANGGRGLGERLGCSVEALSGAAARARLTA